MGGFYLIDLSCFSGEIFIMFFLLFEFGFMDEFFLFFFVYLVDLLFYFCFTPPSFTYLYIEFIELSRYLWLFPFLTAVLLLSASREAWEAYEALWWLRSVKVEAWWLCLEVCLVYLNSFVYLLGCLGCLAIDEVGLVEIFFLRLLLNFFNIQNWLLSMLFWFL